MYIEPEKDLYEVGDVIRCTADAYPAAFYRWENMRTSEFFNTRDFRVTADLRGQVTSMRCHAQNLIQGFIYLNTFIVYVNVL